MKINTFKGFDVRDWPGVSVTRVFVFGVDFKNPYANDIELKNFDEAARHSFISNKELFKFLKDNRNWIEGVSIGGGEPTIYKDVFSFCEKIKKLGFLVKLDTHGMNPEVIRALMRKKLIDFVSLQIRAPKNKYDVAIGYRGAQVNFILEKINQSLRILKKSRYINYELKTVFSPEALTEEDILSIGRWVSPGRKYTIEKIKNPNSSYLSFKPFYSKDLFFNLRKKLSPLFDKVEIKNVSSI